MTDGVYKKFEDTLQSALKGAERSIEVQFDPEYPTLQEWTTLQYGPEVIGGVLRMDQPASRYDEEENAWIVDYRCVWVAGPFYLCWQIIA